MDEPTVPSNEKEKNELAGKMGVKLPEGKTEEPAPEKDKAVPEKPVKEAEPTKPAEEPDYKKMWGDSTREVNENLLPIKKEHEQMLNLIDEDPELAEAWERAIAKKSGVQEENKSETSPIETRVEKLEKEKREEGVQKIQEGIDKFKEMYPDIEESEFFSLSADAVSHISKYGKRGLPLQDAWFRSLQDECNLRNLDKVKAEGRKEALTEKKQTDDASMPGVASKPAAKSQGDLSQNQKDMAIKLSVDPEKVLKYKK